MFVEYRPSAVLVGISLLLLQAHLNDAVLTFAAARCMLPASGC